MSLKTQIITDKKKWPPFSVAISYISCAFSSIFVSSVVTSYQLRVKVEFVGIGDAHADKVANWQVGARNEHFAVNFG